MDDDQNRPPTSRRDALKLGFAGLVSAFPLSQALAKGAPAKSVAELPAKEPHAALPEASRAVKPAYLFFNAQEILFIEAATSRLIPADETWGGALEAWVPNYIDKQLAGSWGAGERLYRSGPWREGLPTQGYQLAFTPAELYRTALKSLNVELAKKPFHKMSEAEQDAFLHELEKSDRDLSGVPAKIFFATLLKSTMEGFLADPVYGGNHDMMAWRMIGFPGASASYAEIVDKHGIKVTRKPMSLAEDFRGHVHMNPNIPAHLKGS